MCTLCSCYPAALLGPSPSWYKSRSFRARAVRRPRELLASDFGLQLPADVALRVHDSTADLRYLVLPSRPAHADGLLHDEERLARLVTRDHIRARSSSSPGRAWPGRPPSISWRAC